MKIFLSLLLILYSSTSFAIENINLTKGKNFFEKKILNKQESNSKKVLFIIPKILIAIFICQKYILK